MQDPFSLLALPLPFQKALQEGKTACFRDTFLPPTPPSKRLPLHLVTIIYFHEKHFQKKFIIQS
jgi:hypothetical protein